MTNGYIDMHCDTLSRLVRDNGSLRSNALSIDLERMKRAGCTAQFFAMFLPVEKTEKPLDRCMLMVDKFWREMEENADIVAFAGSAADIEKNSADGKMSALLTVEDSGIFGCGMEALRVMHRLGVRLVTLTWNFRNRVGSPHVSPETMREGLSGYGVEFVRECENTGVLVDVSHLSDAGFWDVVRSCTKPFAASHSNSRAVAANSRNLTDEMLRALADKGGVAGLNFCADFICPGQRDIHSRLADCSCTMADVAAHAKHMIDVGGEDCVAIGSDFDGIDAAPAGLERVEGMPALEDAFLKAGITPRVIDKIFCGNTLRVLRDTIG